MTEINLLPWREQKREQEKKLFMTMLASSIAITVLVLLLVNYYATSLVSNQNTRNQIIKNEIAVLDKQILEIKALKKVREALISRMYVVRNLQSTRTLMVHLFDELIKIIPPGIYITKLERQKDIVSVWGYSESNTNISIMMRSIENNQWIQNPSLTEIKKVDEKDQAADNEFKLSFILKPKYPGGN